MSFQTTDQYKTRNLSKLRTMSRRLVVILQEQSYISHTKRILQVHEWRKDWIYVWTLTDGTCLALLSILRNLLWGIRLIPQCNYYFRLVFAFVFSRKKLQIAELFDFQIRYLVQHRVFDCQPSKKRFLKEMCIVLVKKKYML